MKTRHFAWQHVVRAHARSLASYCLLLFKFKFFQAFHEVTKWIVSDDDRATQRFWEYRICGENAEEKQFAGYAEYSKNIKVIINK